jgi:hypothetical protein
MTIVAHSAHDANVGKGLAAHLQVPLPYLLYRAQTRYEEDLRGLQDIRGALSVQNAHPSPKGGEELAVAGDRPVLTLRISNRLGSNNAPLSANPLSATPLGVRVRLNSLGNHSQRPMASSTRTLQGFRRPYVPLRPASPSPPNSEDSEDEAAAREEEADRILEEQETLANKLAVLQRMMTSEALGLVSPIRPSSKGKEIDRGRHTKPTQGVNTHLPDEPSGRFHRPDELSSRSHSVSSASSQQNSIPSIPSPPPETQQNTTIGKHLVPSKSSSPPALSPRSAHGQSNMRFGPSLPPTGRSEQGSEVGSGHGHSSASSFSDISGQSHHT